MCPLKKGYLDPSSGGPRKQRYHRWWGQISYCVLHWVLCWTSWLQPTRSRKCHPHFEDPWERFPAWRIWGSFTEEVRLEWGLEKGGR